ncbi:MAG: hypothetical protein Q9163_003939 [Psora crenata]
MPKTTTLQALYLNRGKLDALLKREFGNNYTVKVGNELAEITAPRDLNQVSYINCHLQHVAQQKQIFQAEIDSVMDTK